jgi:hypothetical protein
MVKLAMARRHRRRPAEEATVGEVESGQGAGPIGGPDDAAADAAGAAGPAGRGGGVAAGMPVTGPLHLAASPGGMAEGGASNDREDQERRHEWPHGPISDNATMKDIASLIGSDILGL